MWYYSSSFGLALLQLEAHTESVPDGNSGVLIWVVVGVVLGIGIGVLLSLAFRKSKPSVERAQPSAPPINTPPTFQNTAPRAGGGARRCPVCNSTYTDEALIYCVSDGSPLVPVQTNSQSRDPQATGLAPESRGRDLPPTEAYRPGENLK